MDQVIGQAGGRLTAWRNMNDINSVTLVGRLTRDAEIKTLPSGLELAEFSLASSYSIKKADGWDEATSFFDVVNFKPGGRGKYLVKGKQVVVSGELRQERWEKDGQKRSKVKVIAFNLELLGGGEKAESKPAETSTGDSFEDDVPFN